jgi:hypothetical protein
MAASLLVSWLGRMILGLFVAARAPSWSESDQFRAFRRIPDERDPGDHAHWTNQFTCLANPGQV